MNLSTLSGLLYYLIILVLMGIAVYFCVNEFKYKRKLKKRNVVKCNCDLFLEVDENESVSDACKRVEKILKYYNLNPSFIDISIGGKKLDVIEFPLGETNERRSGI